MHNEREIHPGHYKNVKFPQVKFRGSDVGHVPFMENEKDIERAIAAYLNVFEFSN